METLDEYAFPVRFSVVNAAVHRALSEMARGRVIPYEQSEGYTAFEVGIYDPETNEIGGGRIFVQERLDCTTVELVPYAPEDFRKTGEIHTMMEPYPAHAVGIEVWLSGLSQIFNECIAQVCVSIGYSHPDYGRIYVPGLTPAPPPITGVQGAAGRREWKQLFLWKYMFAPQMPDHELAPLLHVNPQTIRNNRPKMWQPGKRAPRRKKEKGKESI